MKPPNPYPDFRKRIHGIYAGMERRTRERKFAKGRNVGRVIRHAVPIPFNALDLEAWFMKIRGTPDTPFQCRYCRGWITLMVAAIDHKEPISRGGSVGLENLDDICATCNSCKGKLLPSEFEWFIARMQDMGLKFGETAVKDITSRLSNAVKLAASRWHMKKKIENAKAPAAPPDDF
jgi:5-methylcytosine-specific restriction endonuclease McrA